MAFKPTKAETVTRDKLAADLRVAHEQVERTIRAYNDALRAAGDFAEQRAAAWREQHDGRSERWQRSNTGSVVDAFIDDACGYVADIAPPQVEFLCQSAVSKPVGILRTRLCA